MFSQRLVSTRNIATRGFATTSRMAAERLRIGYIPEHFSTPLHFAIKHFGLEADIKPFPTGTGALTASLKDNSIDVAIGLTEGFIADLGKTNASKETPAYKLVGTYVESPLCWAISVGNKSSINNENELNGTRVGVSRIGSGSYVMSYVLADQKGWLEKSKKPFEVVPLGDFKALRHGVNEGDKADFFMWEHFTTKKFYDNGELKRVGEIYTPWPSWMIVARDAKDKKLEVMAEKLNQGVQYFREHQEESVEHITGTMEYSQEDANAWLKTVKFADDVRGVESSVVEHTISILKKGGVLDDNNGGVEGMVAISRSQKGQ
ncbi:periplasmic binding protein-like II, partial [Aureobasidium melanogenum]